MPLFEYECRDCGKRFEQLVRKRDVEVVCRACGSSTVSQLLSTFAVAGGSRREVAETGPCGACGAPQRGTCNS